MPRLNLFIAAAAIALGGCHVNVAFHQPERVIPPPAVVQAPRLPPPVQAPPARVAAPSPSLQTPVAQSAGNRQAAIRPTQPASLAQNTSRSGAVGALGSGLGIGRLIHRAEHQSEVAEPQVLPQPLSLTGLQGQEPADSIQVSPDHVPAHEPPMDRYPVNLATALQLAGSSNLQVALAQERVREAYARQELAEVLWVPNISGGVGFNDHAGQLQNIEGKILEINRQSLFVGGGAGFGRSPLAGGANPPARMGIDLSPVDVIFEPLAARQTTQRANADASAVFNDTLFQVSLTYLELVRAQAQVAIAREAVDNTNELVQLTGDFARTGAGLEADAQRALADLADRERDLLAGEERVRVVSAELARLLRLDQGVTLFALETQPLPITLISEDVPLESLIAQAVQMRPEIARQSAQIAAADSRISQEKWRPWVPSLHVGVGGGTFGGGRNSDFGNFSGRYDLDALAVWELRNLGFGNHALVRERTSQYQQACIAYHAARDQAATDVTQAYHQSVLRRQQIAFTQQQIAAAADALPLNFNGIRGRELRPIEAQQAIAALALARNRYVNAVVEHNQAQLALWRAIGQPPSSSVATAAAPPVAPPAE
jgi:outer membrane protein TolC